MNNLIYHNGNPSIEFFSCNTSKVDKELSPSAYCSISDLLFEEGKAAEGLIPCKTYPLLFILGPYY
jgi:hypothetical protein